MVRRRGVGDEGFRGRWWLSTVPHNHHTAMAELDKLVQTLVQVLAVPPGMCVYVCGEGMQEGSNVNATSIRHNLDNHMGC